MRLGFDVDGIVADMPQAMIDYINKTYNLNYTIDVFEHYNIFKNKYVDDDELNTKIAQDTLDNVVESEEVCYNLKPYDEAIGFLQKLKRSGHTLHFITSRTSDLEKITVAWFRKHKIPFDTLDVIGLRGYGNPSTKGMRGRTLNLDFFIDDHIDHLYDFYRYKKRWRKGLAIYNRPWNINKPVDTSMFIRFNNWKEIIRHLGIHKR